jgi:N-acetylneuraminic acid mutarotase
MNLNTKINMKKLLQNKTLIFMLLSILMSGSFITMFNFVSAQNVAEDSWNTKASLNEARYGMGTVVVDGNIYAIGGIAEGRHTNTNERYDPKADKWVTLAPMPTSRAGIAVAAYQNKIYCIGGTGYGANTRGWVEVYDIATNSWDTKSFAPFSKLGNSQAYTIDGKIYVTLNSMAGGSFTFDMYMYDPATDVWTTKASMPGKILSVSASFMFDNKITTMGSFVESDALSYKVLIYDSTGDKWSEKIIANPPFFGVFGATTGVYAPQKIYSFPMMLNRPIHVYDFASDTLMNATDMITVDILRGDGVSVSVVCSSFNVVVVDDVFYVMGGLANGESVALNSQYVPVGYHGNSFFSLDGLGFIVVLVVSVGVIVVAGLVVYFKRGNRK